MSSSRVGELQFGRFSIAYDQAAEWVTKHVEKGPTKFGYPAYDSYLAESSSAELTEADLLAPLLLNAGPNLKAYYWLLDQLDELNAALVDIDPSASVIGDEADLLKLAPLFKVLDRGDRTDVRTTILAKVLHRKRPAIIPLFDRYIANCYIKGAGAPIQRDRNRTYGDFMVAIARAMRVDLLTDRESWSGLASLASNPTITELRALDIVVWTYGQKRARRPAVPKQVGAHGSFRTRV